MTPAFILLLEPQEAGRRIPGWPADRNLLAVVSCGDAILVSDVEGDGMLDVLSWLPVHPAVLGRRGIDLDFAREAALVKAVCEKAARRHSTAGTTEPAGEERPAETSVDPSTIATAGLHVGDLVRIDSDPSGAYVLKRQMPSRLARIGHDLALSFVIVGAFFMGLLS